MAWQLGELRESTPSLLLWSPSRLGSDGQQAVLHLITDVMKESVGFLGSLVSCLSQLFPPASSCSIYK